MTTWTQDYPALEGSADAAARLAYTVANQHLPGRASDAFTLVEHLFSAGLARSSPASNLNLITEAERGRVRFELHYPNDQADTTGSATAVLEVSRLADAYGERPTRRGRMMYAELWTGRH
ncbi:hypothetical protein [Nonomuraea indica]|uniref:hypothetical protein n=1 Tax=Nonomuraea indica TaxID=1581193 RepID=UPI0011840403|nr:hypothetical protein [Nonomuraea indica]